jgi:DNA polymerase I-like protein with 3'-5' exonuclease and polymerase domains
MRHVILNSDEDVKSFFDFMDAEIPHGSIVALDLETDNSFEIQANIYGIGLAFHDEEGYYIPVRKPNGDLFFDINTLDYISELSNRLKNYRLIGHNIIYDVLVWRHSTGVNLTPYVHADTILMKHTIDEEPPFGLKELAVREFGEGADLAQKELYENIKQNGGSTTKECMEMFKADTHVLGKYCAHDVMLTYKLFELYSKRIEQEGLSSFFYDEEVMPLYREVTIPMKYHGIYMDVDFLKELSKEIVKDIKILEEKVHISIRPLIEDYERDFLNENYPSKPTGNFPKVYAELIGLGELKSIAKKSVASLEVTTEEQKEFKQWMLGEIAELSDKVKIRETQVLMHKRKTNKDTVFNLSSKAQLKWLFFEKLGLDPLNKTETGEPQVDDKFLDSIAKDYEWVGYLQDMNKLEKLRSTYIDGMMEYIIDGKVYTSMLQFGTTSGRYASRAPNCLSLDTQILTTDGWKNYDEIDLNTKVACFDGSKIIFEKPTAYHFFDAEEREMVTIKNTHFDIRVTADHRMVYRNKKTGKISIAEARNFKKDSSFLHGAYYEGGDLSIDEFWLRFLIAIQADGYLGDYNIDFKFGKKRKYDRLLWILEKLKLDYRIGNDRRGFRIYVYNVTNSVKFFIGENKIFPSSWVNFTANCRKIFLEEIMYWDGLSTRKTNYSSSEELNADLVQALFALEGIRAHKRKYTHSRTTKPNFQIDITQQSYSLTANSRFEIVKSKEAVWCVTVPTGMILVRRGSDTFITGNCQNLPRPKEEDSGLSEVVLKYNNSIRKAFISAPNWVFVDADYSALEPRCFAHMSGDKNLQSIFHSGEDMYSSIAKRVFNLEGVSTFKSDPNFLGKLYPEKRQIIKALALAVTYGAEAFRISDLLNISKEEAQKLIDDYLKAYPGLKNYISDSHYQAVTKGYVKTIFGRIRHLPTVKELYDRYGYNLLNLKWAKQKGLTEERRTLKNGLNNSTNFRIQGLAAHIVNRAMLNIMRTLKENNLNGYVCLQVHDQIVVHCPEEEAEITREIVKYCMENVAQLSVPLVAEPKIAKNLKDSH